MEVDVDNGVEIAGVGGGEVARSVMGPRRLIPFILVIVLTLAAALTAVLSASSPASGSTAVRAALDSMMEAKSVTFALNVNLAGAQSAKASVNGSCATGPVCQVTFSGTSGASSLAESQVVVVNGMMYMELGAPLASQLPTPWISEPLKSSGTQQSTKFAGTSNLSSVLAGLAKVGDTVTDDGAVTLNGQVTQEYTVSASQTTEQQQFEAVLKALPTADSSVLGAVSVGGFNVNIYIGANGNIAEVDLSTSVTTAQGSESLSLTLALSGYGRPVNVTAPPANQVTPLSSALTGSTLGL